MFKIIGCCLKINLTCILQYLTNWQSFKKILQTVLKLSGNRWWTAFWIFVCFVSEWSDFLH